MAVRLSGAELPDEGDVVAVDVDGTRVAVARVDGTLYAFQDECLPPRCCASSAARRHGLLRPRAPLGQLDERFFGPQVPGENPEHWIAERAPPACS